MGLRIRTNIASINSQRRLEASTNKLTDSAAKLASGKRINRAADDAAGLAISSNLGADIRSLTQARRNASDGVSLVQTAEGSLEETTNMLTRLRELAVQAATDTVGETERSFINKEFVALKDEIDRIANATEFNGTRLIIGQADLPDDIKNQDGTFPLEIQVGKDYFGAGDVDGIESRNQVNIIKIDLQNINAFTEGEGSLDIGRANEGTNTLTKQDAQVSINKLDDAIVKVSDYRSYLGAIQNRLGSTIDNLGSTVENLSAANSRIMDTDFAEETARYTSNKILQQGGASILAQANQQPQIALSLMQSL